MDIPEDIPDLMGLPKEELVARLMEAESALEAIKGGEIDALIVSGPTADEIYTLKDADQPYRLLVEKMNEGAVTLVDDTILYSNLCFAHMLRRPLEKTIGSSIYDYLHPKEQGKFAEFLKRSQQSDIVREEFDLLAENAKLVQVQITVNHMFFDGFSGYSLIITDVTDLKLKDREIIERKEREKVLSESQEQLKEISAKLERSNKDLQQFASIVESSDDAIISKDLKGIIVSWNNGAERIFGYKAQEVIGKPITILIPNDRHDEEPAILRRIIQGESIDHYDTVRRRKDGRLIDISLTISPIRNLKGEIIGASKIAHDITERKKAEEELKRFASILEEKVTERTQILEDQTQRLRQLALELTEVEQKERRRLAEVLHDHLQQYLVATKMRLELIERRGANADASGFQDARSYIDKAIDAARHLTAELRPSVLYEGGLSAGLRYLRQKTEVQHKILIHLVLSPDIEPGTDLIKVLLYQCIQELLFNTVKYAGVSECYVTVTRLENRSIQVVAEDKGIGFDLTKLTHNDKGGFGLFSIRERVKALGGEFVVASFPGQGSKFTITIPDAMELSAIEEHDPSKDNGGRRKRTDKEGIVVLVVDDHLIIRQSIASLLLSQPFVKEVIEAGNGEEAVRKAGAVDIILMDINMPVLNGIEATRILRHRNPHTKIIGLSVQTEGEMAQAMKDVGAVAYFNKGDNTNSLIDSIKKFAYN
jgi:PAS domain S-box-containing protein